jgi:hypothetical protein
VDTEAEETDEEDTELEETALEDTEPVDAEGIPDEREAVAAALDADDAPQTANPLTQLGRVIAPVVPTRIPISELDCRHEQVKTPIVQTPVVRSSAATVHPSTEVQEFKQAKKAGLCLFAGA